MYKRQLQLRAEGIRLSVVVCKYALLYLDCPEHGFAPFDVFNKNSRLNALVLSVSERIFVYSLTHVSTLVKRLFRPCPKARLVGKNNFDLLKKRGRIHLIRGFERGNSTCLVS